VGIPARKLSSPHARPRRASRRLRSTAPIILLAAFTAAFSGIAYELMLASYATFLMGATVFQYSLVVSLMMASMGAGALVTGRLRISLLPALLGVEIALAAIAAVALPVLYAAFASRLPSQPLILLLVVAMGGLIGMEIPLLNRLSTSRDWLPRILFFDYLGGFVGGILFPVVLVPALGLFRVAGLLSLINAGVAVLIVAVFRHRIPRLESWATACALVTVVAIAAFAGAEPLRMWMEGRLFGIRYPP